MYLSRLPLEVFCPSWSTETVAVVLEHERVLALSPAARASGLRCGMRHASVALLLPQAQAGVQLHVRESAREVQALQESALALLQYTPLVTLAEQATLLLDIGASLRLFGGIRALCREVAASMQRLGFSASLACAPTARGAWLLAQAGGRRCLGLPKLARYLDQLPVTLLPPLQAFLPWLAGIGCTTVAELRRLPRAGLQRRCGKAVLEMLDAAYGQTPELFEWIEAPPHFKARFEFFERVLETDGLDYAVQRLLAQMSGWLCARHLAVQGIHLFLIHERGRYAIEPTQIEIQLGEPSCQETHLLRLLKERLRQCELPAAVMSLVLEAVQVQPVAPVSESLFPEPGGTPADYQRLLELLTARLGGENVLQAMPKADYRPEMANQWLPVMSLVKSAKPMSSMQAMGPGGQGTELPRPCWLLAKPVALLLRDNRPFYGSPLKMVSPPERIESGWWNGELVLRDYFVAQGRDNVYYWVYRERLAAQPCWYLHGLFG